MKHKTTILLSLAALLLAGSYAAQAVFPLPEAAAADRSESRALEAKNTVVKQREIRQERTVSAPRAEQAKTADSARVSTQPAKIVAPAPKPEPKPETPAKSEQAGTLTATVGHPRKIVIPTVGIDAPILDVGLTSTGNMDTAKGWENTGWYKLGPKPGQPGSAVIAGHYESGPNVKGVAVPGVFENLRSIKLGDAIYIDDGSGKRMRFTVSDMRIVEKDSDTSTIFASGGTARITVITCHGTWLPDQKTFSHRLIVTASLSE